MLWVGKLTEGRKLLRRNDSVDSTVLSTFSDLLLYDRDGIPVDNMTGHNLANSVSESMAFDTHWKTQRSSTRNRITAQKTAEMRMTIPMSTSRELRNLLRS